MVVWMITDGDQMRIIFNEVVESDFPESIMNDRFDLMSNCLAKNNVNISYQMVGNAKEFRDLTKQYWKY